MEEILASIRRIIADDQSLPGHGAFREAPGLRGPVEEPSLPPAPAEPLHAPVHVLHPETAAPIRDMPAAATRPHEEPYVEPPLASPVPEAHGYVAAPQFVSPAGPVEVAAVAPASMTHVPPVAPPPGPVAFEPLRSVPPMESVHAPSADAVPEFQPEPEPLEYDAPIGFEAAPPPPESAPSLFSTATDHSLTSAFNMLAATRLADNSDELLAMTREMIRPILKAWLDDNLPSMVERLVRAEIERVSRGGR